ncbi:MAG TPA: IS66 family transposase [Acidimicrobiales bacterium]|nr:IS66 family transposase [Acidimicrobiales bacterium]
MLNDRQASEIAEQTVVIAELKARLADLEQRLGRTPRNSSMPPSAEGLSKPPAANRAERRAAKRRPGKQPGSEGKHLAQVADPDEVVTHLPGACTGCGAGLENAEVISTERRQVFDLPDICVRVVEHVAERRRCRCGCETKASFPAEATAPAAYGHGVRALTSYLAVHQHLPYGRMAELFSDLLGIEISVGALAQMVAEAGELTEPFTDEVRYLLRRADAVHFDETGGRVAGKLHWVHSASTSLLTLLDCHQRRGRAAMDDLGVIDHMAGIAHHDGWQSYRAYDVVHSLCNAHHLRELDEISWISHQFWAGDMAALLCDAKHIVETAKATGATSLSAGALHSIRVRYGLIIAAGRLTNPGPLSHKRHGYEKKAYNLLVRLDNQRADVLRFASDFHASFDNNQAERDIRMVKLQQKISGSWRTLAGARAYCAIRSYVSTLRKQNQDILGGLRLLFEGQPWLPAPT